MNSTEEIKFKCSKAGLVAGIILMTIGLFVEAIIMTDTEETGVAFWVGALLSSIFPMFMILIGIMVIKEHFANGRKLRETLERYGEANLIAHMRSNTVGIFQKNQYTDKVYFTDRFVIEPTTAIIHYGEISWMYKHITRHKNTSTVYVAFVLIDGTKHFLCDYAEDSDITSIMQTCQRYNPNIIFGYSKETEALHEQNVKRYKSGLMPLAHVQVPVEVMERSNRYEEGKKNVTMGIVSLVSTLIGIVLCMSLMGDLMEGLGRIVILVIAIPGVVIGVLSLLSGLDKISKSKK